MNDDTLTRTASRISNELHLQLADRPTGKLLLLLDPVLRPIAEGDDRFRLRDAHPASRLRYQHKLLTMHLMSSSEQLSRAGGAANLMLMRVRVINFRLAPTLEGHYAHEAGSAESRFAVLQVAVDIGQVIDLAGAEAQAQGASIDGLSMAIGQQLHIENGRIQEQTFKDYAILRLPSAPQVIETYFAPSDFPPTGMGEPAFPAMPPAIANAIFAATGERLRAMPFSRLGYTV